MNDSTKDMFNIVDIASHMLTVGHPNGTLVKITTIGSLRLTSGIVLFDVFVVPEYNARLLSVNKMIKDIKFFVGFDENKCYIQFECGKIIGTGSKTGSLYFFDLDKNGKCITAKSNSVFVCHVSSELWHYRLGRIADQVLSTLGLLVRMGISFSLLLLMTLPEQFRLPSSVLSSVSPFLVYGKDPGLSHASVKKAYKLYGLDRKNVFYSKDVKFMKTFFFQNEVQRPKSPYDVEGESSNVEGDNVTFEGNVQINQNGEGPSNVFETSPILRRSTRKRVMPSKFSDFVVSSNVKYSLEKYVCYANLSSSNLCSFTTLNKSSKPKTFHEASDEVSFYTLFQGHLTP
nr:ribonuclease H-like domain-containing protein [Tanacetum cinerariifolium]